MAKPRVFISSTYFDLKHIRLSLDKFILSLGFETVLSEKGDVAFQPDLPLDESCYREVGNADLLVLIVGGRYGSKASNHTSETPKEFYDRYDSITKMEYRKALELDLPTYIIIQSNVFTEYQTFVKNRSNATIEYAHVDSVNIFSLIDEIIKQRRNNPMFAFERESEIEQWLRDQWAGLFRDLLNRSKSEVQLKSLSSEITNLSELNKTLKTYMENILRGSNPEQSNRLIRSEEERLKKAEIDGELRKNPFIDYMIGNDVPFRSLKEIITKANNIEDLVAGISKIRAEAANRARDVLESALRAKHDLDSARLILGLGKLEWVKKPRNISED